MRRGIFVPGLLAAIIVVLLPVTLTSAGSAAPQDTIGVQSVERLVIRYHEGNYQLMSRTTIQKVLPPSLALPDSAIRVAGTWFEVQTSDGNLLYRRPMPPPQIAYVELPKDSVTGQIERKETILSDRTFVITVPLRNDAVQVAFFDRPPRGARKTQASQGSQVVGRIQLR